MLTIKQNETVEVVNLKLGNSDFNYLKQFQAQETSIAKEDLPPAGKFSIEGDSGNAVEPSNRMKMTVLHDQTFIEDQEGGIAFDSDGSIWVAFTEA